MAALARKKHFSVEWFVFPHPHVSEWVNTFQLSFGSATVSVVVNIIVDVRVRCIGVTVFVSGIILIIFSLSSLFFQESSLISVMLWFFFQCWHVGLGLSALVFVICWFTLFISSSSVASKPFSSTFRSRCAPICSYVPISKWA